MSNLIEAAKKAQAALEESVDLVRNEYENDWRHGIPSREGQLAAMKQQLDAHMRAIAELQQAIEEAEKAEPVARLMCNSDGKAIAITEEGLQRQPEYVRELWKDAIKLYTHPPALRELSDEEIINVANNCKWNNTYHKDFARAILKAAKE